MNAGMTLLESCKAVGMLLGGLHCACMGAPLTRMAALTAGLALVTWPSLQDQATLTGSIWLGDMAAKLGMWALATVFILIPPIVPGAWILFTRMLKKVR